MLSWFKHLNSNWRFKHRPYKPQAAGSYHTNSELPLKSPKYPRPHNRSCQANDR